MNSRIPEYLRASRQKDLPSQPAIQELLNLAQKQIASRMRQVESFVHKHPVTGIGAAFCIGIFLGWVIKRK
jgi:ElaB/YqjD/DUF883 family membrane-anchored ribosome-binding protein